MSAYSFYDDLRVNETENFQPIFIGNHVGRNLHRYGSGEKQQDGESASAGDEDFSFVMCHVPIFMRYTLMHGDGNLTDTSDVGYGASAAALMAIEHWNSGNGVVVKEIEGMTQSCKVRFTTEIFDTQARAIPAVKGIAEMMTRSPNSVIKPQPCAVVGTEYSSVSGKFATVTGVYDLLQVSPGASSDVLDNKDAYPLFSRTHPSDRATAKLLPNFMNVVMNVQKLAVVFVADDGFGLSYIHFILDYAEENGLNILPVPLNFQHAPTKEDIKGELKVLLDSKLNYVIGVFFRDKYAPIMEAAGELGLAGPGKMWLFSGSIATYLYENAQTFEKNSILANATFGNAVITDGGGAPGAPEYETFVDEWKKLGSNPEALSYINSKQPQQLSLGGKLFNFNRTKDWFDSPPHHVSIYAYEAIIGMGISACQAASESSSTFEENDVFSGADHHKAFLNINFRSASGEVKISPDNFSRDGPSTYYVVSNILEINSTDTTITMKGQKYAYFDGVTREWKPYINGRFMDQFIFSDGTTNAPPQISPAKEDMNLISAGVRASCLVLVSVIIIIAITFVTYTVKMRKHPVIRMAQPPFLVMICLGTFIMSLAIIPESMDEGVLSQQGLNRACSLPPWFYSFGFTITFAALFSKLWRVNKVVNAGRACQRVTVTLQDVMVPFGVLITSNAFILSIREGIAPSSWERTTLATNNFDQVTTSKGSCKRDQNIGFIIAILVVNGVALLLACYQAYIGRKVRTEMNESKYIGMAMVCIFQSFFFGIPLLFLTLENRSASLFIATSICFVICVATLLFIFIPKILAQREKDNERNNTRASSTISGLSARARQLRASSRASTNTDTMSASLLQLRAQQRVKRLSSVSEKDSRTADEQSVATGSKRRMSRRMSAFPIRASGEALESEVVVQEDFGGLESAKREPDVEFGAPEELR